MADVLDIGASADGRPEVRSPPLPAVTGGGLTPQRRRPSLLVSAIAALDQRRLFVMLPFAMIAGLICSVEAPTEIQAAPLLLGAALLAVATILLRRSLPTLRLLAAAAAFWIGLGLLPLYGALWGTVMLDRPAYGSYQLRVDEVLSDEPSGMRIIVSAINPGADARTLPIRRARLLVRHGPPLAPGDIIAGPVRFAPVPGPIYPGGYDTQFHAYFAGIGAYGNSTQPPTLVAAGAPNAPDRLLDATRRGIAARIDATLAQPAAGIARAIIVGDQSMVDEAARHTMATAGIAHVLSVSGLHLSLVAGGVFAVLRLLLAAIAPLAARVSIKRIAAVAGIASAVFYLGIAGGNVAAFRSTLMIVLVFGAMLAGRRALTMRNVAIAAIVVIAADPADVFRPSFQLSFAAVVALIGAYEGLRHEAGRDRSAFGHALAYGRGIVVTSLVAGGATLVFSVYHFQQTSPLGVVGNLVSLPLVGFVMMPAAALAVLLMPLGLEQPLLVAMGWSIDRMLQLAGWVAELSAHLTASPLLTPWALVFALLALAWFAFFRDRWRLLGPVVAVPLVVLFAVDHPPDVLVADTTQAIAIRGQQGLELAAGRSRSFALDVWRDTYSELIDTSAAESCDSIACIGTAGPGFSYAIIDDPGGFAEECGQADLVVTRRSAPSWCHSAAVIDGDALRRHGVHWLRWNAADRSFEVRRAVEAINRPWRVVPR